MPTDGLLTNLLEVRQELKFNSPATANDLDSWLTQLITRASAGIKAVCDERYLLLTDVVEIHSFDGGQSKLFLAEWPVAATPALAVYEDTNRAYGADTLLTANEDYHLDSARGVITRISGSEKYFWQPGFGTVRVAYRGGYNDVLNDKALVPKLLRDLAVQNVVANYRAVEARHRGEQVKDQSGKKIVPADGGIEIPVALNKSVVAGLYTRIAATLSLESVTRTAVA